MSGNKPIANKMEAKMNWISPMMHSCCLKEIIPWSGCSDHSDIASEAICLPKNFTKALSSIFWGDDCNTKEKLATMSGGWGGW